MESCDLRFTGGLTLNEALAMIEDVHLPHTGADITLFPPENARGNITDEDSGDEDNLHPNNLPANQLRAPAEINFPQTDGENMASNEEDDVPLAQLASTSTNSSAINKKRKIQTSYKWVCEDIGVYATEEWLTDRTDTIKQMTPLQLFEMFFDECIIKLIVTETNRYASQKNKLANISSQEIKCFLGVLILSGYIQLPRRRMFWEKEKDTHNDLVASSISRDRFEFIMSHFHLTDNNTLNRNDKFAKMRPLFASLNKKFLELAPLQESHSVDEAMVPYFGRHGCKQYIHGKPIRYGYKFWMGCTRLGYVNWFEPYQGASTHTGTEYRHLGVGAGVVLTYADALKSKWPDAKFHLYFDNFFCSLPLLTTLSEKNLLGTGTIRTNRIQNNPFSSTDMKKKPRGYYESRMCVSPKIILIQWNDNSIVTMCSNEVGVQPIHSVKRFSQREKKNVNVDQPHMIRLYNANMGGVDRCDENVSLYRTSIRGKKWYFPLVSQCIDMAVHNAWQLHKLNNGDMDHLTFRRHIAIGLLQQNKKVGGIFSRGRPSQTENINIRYDKIEHYVIPQDKQTKCRHCHSKTTTRCEKCDIGLHVKCFVAYHTL